MVLPFGRLIDPASTSRCFGQLVPFLGLPEARLPFCQGKGPGLSDYLGQASILQMLLNHCLGRGLAQPTKPRQGRTNSNMTLTPYAMSVAQRS